MRRRRYCLLALCDFAACVCGVVAVVVVAAEPWRPVVAASDASFGLDSLIAGWQIIAKEVVADPICSEIVSVAGVAHFQHPSVSRSSTFQP